MVGEPWEDEQGLAGVGWRGRSGVTGQAVRWVAGRVLWAGKDSEHSQGRQSHFENYVKTAQRVPGQAALGRVVTTP